ncbi:MAG: M20/M25/M40 family metallo-hydrolase [Anaerolineaceae bacterium]|nr:M20/M25/M40 family metallo-hydrolase [Anaerolineaceae bacterium]
MTVIEPFLLSLLSAPGLSGSEEPVSRIIAEKWRPLVDEISFSRLGSLHALRKSAVEGKSPSLMIAAHMDAVGLVVRKIEDGYLLIRSVGGVDERILPGQAVIVHGRKEIPGVVQMLPDRLMPSNLANEPLRFSRLFVDTGFTQKELEKFVQIGDVISFAQSPILFRDDYIAGHSLDNRASIAALTVCLEELKNYNLQWNVWAVATVQEEGTLRGAATSSYKIRPDIAIAMDVTFAKGPGSNNHMTFAMGKGITIGIGSNVHPALSRLFKKIAEEIDMPYAMEPMPRSSGTDSIAMQITADGIPNMVIGIPIRYMHTPVEMASINDIMRAGRLLARFITGLETNALETIFSGKSS